MIGESDEQDLALCVPLRPLWFAVAFNPNQPLHLANGREPGYDTFALVVLPASFPTQWFCCDYVEVCFAAM